MSRIVVVGAGLGGCMAGLAAARANPSADVTLLSTDAEPFRREPGTVDVLGYLPDEPGPVERPLERLSDVPESHPYSRLGVESVRDGVALFDEVTGDSYAGSGDEANALIATCAGEIRPASRYPEGMSSGLVSDTREMLLLSIEQVSAFDAYYVQDKLGERVPYTVGGVPVEFPLDISDSPPATQIARAFDDRESVDGEPVLDSFVEAVRSVLDIEPRVGFPAVLGETSHGYVRETLGEQLNVDVFEIPIGAPSLPGLRLGRQLREALDDAGVTVAEGSPVGYETGAGRITALQVGTDGEETVHETEAVVLATGGLDGPGLVDDRGGVREPVFDCHVPQPDDRAAWTVAAPLADQPFARFGVRVGQKLRPLDGRGNPEFKNLHAVGGVLGGHNAVREKSRSGVAVATGVAAGQFLGNDS